MRRLALVLTLISLAGTTIGQKASYSLDFTLSRCDFADTISIEVEDCQVFVPVEIGGRRLRFLFDTGSSHSVVFTDSPFGGWQTVGAMQSRDASDQTSSVPTVVMPPFRLGSVVYTGCQATLQQRISGRGGMDGILGFDLVCKGLSVKIDTRQGRLILTDRKKLFNGETGFKTRYRLDYHVPYVSISPFPRYTEQARFDTGSPHFYVMNHEHFTQGLQTLNKTEVASLVEGRSQGHFVMGFAGAEPAGEVAFLNLSRLKMGGCLFTDAHALTTGGRSTLGAQLLAFGSLVINPHSRQMLFQPYDSRQPVTVGNSQQPIFFVSADGKPVVGLVWERGEPYRQGFRAGDTIVAIDGRPVQSFRQFSRWGVETGRNCRFTLRDSLGQTRQADWVWRPKEE